LNGRKNFYRCHRSYLVNIRFIKKLNRSEGNVEVDSGQKIPISRDKKSAFEQLLKQ
jgi:two-component system LytT family response regulator